MRRASAKATRRAAALGVWLMACGVPTHEPDPEPVVVELFWDFMTRFGCSGDCDRLLAWVDITGKGVVVRDNDGLRIPECSDTEADFTPWRREEWQVASEHIDAVLALADEVGFWTLPPDLRAPNQLCGPPNRLTLTGPGGEHTVLFVYGQGGAAFQRLVLEVRRLTYPPR